MTKPMQLELVPAAPPAQRHSKTSIASAEAIAPHVSRLHEAVLHALRCSTEGLSDEQLTEVLGWNPSTLRPRRVELLKMGKIVAAPYTRKTRSGRKAQVWRAM